MSSANVLPSAPFEEPLYPQLPSQPEHFRLQRINEIANTLGKSTTIASLPKKYKRRLESSTIVAGYSAVAPKRAKKSLNGVLVARVFSG